MEDKFKANTFESFTDIGKSDPGQQKSRNVDKNRVEMSSLLYNPRKNFNKTFNYGGGGRW